MNAYQNSEDNSKSLGQIIRLILMQSKLIVGITVFGVIVSIFFYFFSTKIYNIQSMLQIYSSSSDRFNGSSSLDFYLGNSNTSDLSNLEDLYKSRSSMIQVIDDMKMNIDVDNYKLDKRDVFKERQCSSRRKII